MKGFHIIGDLNLDVILTGLERSPSPGDELLLDDASVKAGGSAANTAVLLAFAGRRVKLYSRIGTDETSELVVSYLGNAGVDTGTLARDPDDRTGVTLSLPFPGSEGRCYLTFPGTVATTTLGHLHSGYLERGAFMHCASYFLQTGLRRDLATLLRKAKEAGMTTFLDPGKDPDGRWKLAPLLRSVDWLLPNDAEMSALAGEREAVKALAAFTPAARGIVVKCGAEGALSRHQGTILRHPAAEAKVTDTTCAGDSFNAGFLIGMEMELSLEGAVELGNRFGSLAVSCVGLPTKQMVKSLIKEVLRWSNVLKRGPTPSGRYAPRPTRGKPSSPR